MMRYLLLIIIAIVTFGILYYANNPGALDDVWLYLVGLSGAIIKLFQILWEKLKNFGNDLEKQLNKQENSVPPVIALNKQQQNSPPVVAPQQNQNDAVG